MTDKELHLAERRLSWDVAQHLAVSEGYEPLIDQKRTITPEALATLNPEYEDYTQVRPHLWVRNGFTEYWKGALSGARNRSQVGLIVTGDTAVGKNELEREVRARSGIMVRGVSATSRDPRKRIRDGVLISEEEDGVDYYFLSRSEFLARVARDEMLEYQEYAGNLMGLPKTGVENALKSGCPIITMIVEREGALEIPDKIKAIYGIAVARLVVLAQMTLPDYFVRVRDSRAYKQGDMVTDVQVRWRQILRNLKHFGFVDAIVGNPIDETGKPQEATEAALDFVNMLLEPI